MRALVVDDDAELAELVATGLSRHGFAVDVATDGERAVELAELHPYDVIVLDRDLPGRHGDEVCRHLVAGPSTARILMLTAAGALDDRVAGLYLGADDYLPKPFAMEELVARSLALGRRRVRASEPVLRAGDIEVDPAAAAARRGGRELQLTRKELGVLIELVSEPGRVVSAEHLLDKVWDANTDPFTNAIRVTLVTLRRKLGDPPVIATVKGMGYRLDPT